MTLEVIVGSKGSIIVIATGPNHLREEQSRVYNPSRRQS